MEHKKIIFETAEQIKEHFVSLIKNGKKVKDDEIIKACQDIDMSDEDMADLIDEILSIDDQDIDFTGEDEMNVDSMLLDDDIFVPTDEVDLIAAAEEDFEAAELLYGHKYYDQIGTLLSVAMTKYLKAIIEATIPDEESSTFFMTEDKQELLRVIKTKNPDILISSAECCWMDNVYGKANCTDGIHIIMPKQSAVEAFYLLAAVRKEARRLDKESAPQFRYFFARSQPDPEK